MLGLAPGASRAEARAAHLARATALHPDRHPDLTGDERARLDRAMAVLNAAWDRIEASPDRAAPQVDDEHAAGDDDEPYLDPSWPGRLPEPPPGFRVNQRHPAAVLRQQIELVGESRDLLRLATSPWVGLPYRRLRACNRRLQAEHLRVALDALPALRSLDLDGTGVDDRAVAHLARAPDLADLHLSATAITDEALRIVAGLRKLEWLSLADTAVTDAGLVHLGGHPTLAVLNLRGTQVQGPGLGALAECPRLRLLALPSVRREDRRALAERRPDITFT